MLGTGAGTEVVDVAETEVEEATACAFFSERVEYIAAVTPAPVAAETAAMIAIVAFDILKGGCHSAGIWEWYLFGSWEEEADDQDRDIDAREKSS